jgi:hypothetical protein
MLTNDSLIKLYELLNHHHLALLCDDGRWRLVPMGENEAGEGQWQNGDCIAQDPSLTDTIDKAFAKIKGL